MSRKPPRRRCVARPLLIAAGATLLVAGACSRAMGLVPNCSPGTPPCTADDLQLPPPEDMQRPDLASTDGGTTP